MADSAAFNLDCQIPFHLTPSQPAYRLHKDSEVKVLEDVSD